MRPDRTGVPANVGLRPRRSARPAPSTGRRDLQVGHRHRAAQPARLHDRHGAEQGLPLRHLRRPGHPPLGPAADVAARLRARPRRVHDGRGDLDGRGVRPEPGVRQPRRRRPGRARRPHRPARPPGGPAGGAGRHRRPGRRGSSTLLHDSGRWEHSLVVVLADHSMDWSRPTARSSAGDALDGRPAAARPGRDRRERRRLAPLLARPRRRPGRARSAGCGRSPSEVPGVLVARRRTARALRLGPEAGDVVLFCEAGWRFSEPAGSNPIPGNHGHPATRPIPFFLSGGHPAVGRGRRPERARTIDVAPTLSAFFGVGAPRRRVRRPQPAGLVGRFAGHARVPRVRVFGVAPSISDKETPLPMRPRLLTVARHRCAHAVPARSRPLGRERADPPRGPRGPSLPEPGVGHCRGAGDRGRSTRRRRSSQDRSRAEARELLADGRPRRHDGAQPAAAGARRPHRRQQRDRPTRCWRDPTDPGGDP